MRCLAIAVTAVVALFAPGDARADLRSSPGDLSASHASLDKSDKCETCHESDGAISASKCLGCHDHARLASRIASKQGFHASSTVTSRPCKVCHQEHRGRSFNLMGWDAIGGEKKFDHKLTTFELRGMHASTDCAKCHKTTNRQGLRTYLSTDKTCGACHAKDQPHGAIRKAHMACDRCHAETSWKATKATREFNHDDPAQAAMKLEGSHASVACAKCHPKTTFKLPKFDGECSQCHRSPHDGQLFGTKKCTTCHAATLKSLREVRFDHKKQTGYALVAKHGEAKCSTCHTAALATKKPSQSCEGCHARDNKHGSRFDKACTTCHSQRSWKGPFQFNHATNTKFDLTGKHAKASCRSCHRGRSPSEFERFDVANGCTSCHRHGKAHGGKFKNDQCLSCHQEGGSKSMRKDSLETFHGEKSKFPLRHQHASVACQMCHVNDVYQETPRECGVQCHEDSLHRGTLGQECSRCHEPGQWPAIRFDHATKSDYPLTGKHAAVKACEGCHPTRAYKDTPRACSKCHGGDDLHGGALGSTCEKCHTVEGTTTFRHNRDAQFKIDGKHQPLVCASCHKTVAFKPVRKDCFGCHPEPAVHKGRYGTACERCHSTATFADTKAQHDVGDFSLTGAHDQVACARCHPNGEKLRGSGNLCINCHRKDDVHRNALSPRCGECHTQRSFAPARFDHMSVGCGLTGLHRTLPCNDCHKAGNFGAVSPLCASCHRNDALRVRAVDHRTLIDCGRCHNPSAWVPATRIGQQSICR